MSQKVYTKNAPEAIGPYSQGIVVGNLVFTSGQIPLNSETGVLEGNNITEQTHRVCKNLKAVLEEAGSSLQKVVKTVCFLNEMADYMEGFTNERGGKFQIGLYSYLDIVRWAPHTRATPDGRFNGDFLTAGLTPTRLHGDVVTDVFRSGSGLPLKRFPASSVMTLSISQSGLDMERFKALIRSWQILGSCGMLQLNCLTKELLEDAQKNPQDHQDLIVRLYGMSARFVTLDPTRQEEFISRTILK